MEWKKQLTAAAGAAVRNLEDFVDVTWRSFSRRLGLNEPRQIMAYRGYGNDECVWVRGRLLANKLYGGPKDDDTWWDNLKATYERWESDEVPGETIRLTFGTEGKSVVTDDEGYYEASFSIDGAAPRPDAVVAMHDREDCTLTAVHRLALLHPDASFMVISDVDDTVIHTGITDLLRAAQLTFLNNAKTRKPLAGVDGLYRALARGNAADPVNPIFYLSNSAWNMYDLLRDFLDLNDLPEGPLLLRDLGLGTDSSNHKIETLRRLLERYDTLPAVLVGDSGQHDAEIYLRLAEEHPDRVAAIYIRDVDPGADSDFDVRVDGYIRKGAALKIPFLRVSDSMDIARHAAEIGLIPESQLAGIAQVAAVDSQREPAVG